MVLTWKVSGQALSLRQAGWDLLTMLCAIGHCSQVTNNLPAAWRVRNDSAACNCNDIFGSGKAQILVPAGRPPLVMLARVINW